MKPVIECWRCENCAIGFEVGFAGRELLRCSRFGDYVTRDDGCTTGTYGEPGSLCIDHDIDIAEDAAVRGWHE